MREGVWKKQRKLIINCVRTTADKCELMHKNQAGAYPKHLSYQEGGVGLGCRSWWVALAAL